MIRAWSLSVQVASVAVSAALLAGAGCEGGIPVPAGAMPFNFHVVADGRAYRSAQPTADSLASAIEQLGLRTVVNLRGENPDEAWWQQEQQVCESYGVTLVNIRMSAQSLPSREMLLLLYDTFVSAEYPILIHCRSGADRTGAAAAIWRMMQGESREAAMGELSPAYFHFALTTPAPDKLVSLFQPDRDWILNEYNPDAMNGG